MQSILIVDDDLNLCTVLKEELEEVGYNSNFVNSGFEAMDFLKNNQVDLVLLDLKMPAMDGFDVLKEIEQNQKCFKKAILSRCICTRKCIFFVDELLEKPYKNFRLRSGVK